MDWNADRLADRAIEIARRHEHPEDVAGVMAHLLAQEYAEICSQLLAATERTLEDYHQYDAPRIQQAARRIRRAMGRG